MDVNLVAGIQCAPALEEFVPASLLALNAEHGQRGIPAIARSQNMMSLMEEAIKRIPTKSQLMLGDSRELDFLPNESVHLVVTSPPYWNLKEYPEREGQLGGLDDYDEFVSELDQVWAQVFRVLVPGGRLIVVVGDVCVSRKQFQRHLVFPLHASIQEHCRKIGFDNLAPIIWHKISNAKYEVENGGGFLGKPYEPNGIVKNDIEFILFQRKPGGYRKPSLAARLLSVIPQKEHGEWFQPIWNLPGASTRFHPAPYPISLAERLIRMFSFVGDTVLDPFSGTGTTNRAAAQWGRNSLGVEIEPSYISIAEKQSKRRIGFQLQL